MAGASSDLEHRSQPENSAGKAQHLHGLAVPPSRCPLLALFISLGEVAIAALQAVGPSASPPAFPSPRGGGSSWAGGNW